MKAEPHIHQFKKAYIADRKDADSNYNGGKRWILLHFCPQCKFKEAYDLTRTSPKSPV